MGRSIVQDAQQGFAGGLNTTSDPSAMTANQARNLQNYRLNVIGAAQKRGGTRAVLGSGSPATGANANHGLQWLTKNLVLFSSGATPHLYSTQKSHNFDNNPVPWFLTSLTDLGAGSAGTGLLIFSDGTNEVVYTNGGALFALMKFDGTTLSTIVAATKCEGLCVYNQRLWGFRGVLAAGTALDPQNGLYYSNLATASGSIGGDSLGVGASSGGQINVTTFGASRIQALAVVGASLMIFHRRGVSRLTGFGQSDITVTPQAVSGVVSALSQEAVIVNEGVAYVATTNGIYTVTETGAQLLGTPQTPDPTVAVLAANPGNGVQLFINRANNELWVFFPGVGLYTYNLILHAWSGPYVGGKFSSSSYGYVFEMIDANATPRAVMAADQSGTPYELDTPSFALDSVAFDGTGGVAYTGVVQCRRMFGTPALGQTAAAAAVAAKSWRFCDINATLTTGGVAPTVTTVTEIGASDTQTMPTPSSTQQNYHVQTSGQGPWIDVTITDAGTTPSTISAVTVTGFLIGIR